MFADADDEFHAMADAIGEDGHRENADFAAKQIAMFDRMIERFERLAARHPT